MTEDSSQEPARKSESGIISRFVHLLTAQGVDGIASAVLFLYVLPRVDSTVYGQVMYAIAAASIVGKIVQFGLYYPLVSELGGATRQAAVEDLHTVNVIKFILTAASMIGVAVMALYRALPVQMAAILLLICLGSAVEAIAETYFADFRVRGRQDKEARIRIVSAVASYGYGIATASIGLAPILISLFKVVSGVVRLWYGLVGYMSYYAASLYQRTKWPSVWIMFRAAGVFALIEILGVVYNKANVFFLESAVGVKGVAYYSAAYSIVDPVSILASEQFLGWVIFPLLASLWLKNREVVSRLVRRTAQWLLAMALPIMFVLHAESPLIVSLIFPPEYADAVWIQQYLVWTILLSFESNLFCYVMMVAGAAKVLLGFAVVATVLNMVFNVTLVPLLGLTGGSLVLILTKLVMTVLTLGYCQLKFRFFGPLDFLFPCAWGAATYALFLALEPLIGTHIAVVVCLALYLEVTRILGPRFIGRFPSKISPVQSSP